MEEAGMTVNVRAVVLAAGKGTRMLSARPKMLHDICGRPMLWYALRALHEAGVTDITVVTNRDVLPAVAAVAVAAGHQTVRAVLQEPQLGTGHAVQVALAELPPGEGTVLVLNGDMPLVDADLVRAVIAACGDTLALVTARMPLPSSFGRVVRDGAHVARVVEARAALADELAIDEMNAGLYAYDERKLRAALAELRDDNAQKEYYLTDTIAHFASRGDAIVPVVAPDYKTVLGVNDRVELAAAGTLLNRRLCERHMRAGVTIVDPAT
ncbi:MAG: NTP transferase domain-containing protein, partial [Candidatus Eremiobacteraeota bacterium]|nr:NTP transferase domain-containing protein [Candidatus Eremiobacteraeota bacterium]